MKVVREKARDWDVVRNPEQLRTLLEDKLATTVFHLKRTLPPAEFNPGGPVEDGFVYYYAEQVELSDQLTLYTTLKRQLEVDFEVVRSPEPGAIVLRPSLGRIGKVNRAYPRVDKVEGVTAANFQVSKSEVATDITRPQVANQVIFNEFERRLHREFPGLRIYDYADRNRPPETRHLNKLTRAILVEDTDNPESYESRGDEFVDYRKILEEEGNFDKVRRSYKEDHVKSVLVKPLVIETGDRSVPIAFMHCVSRGDTVLDLAAHRRWQELSGEIIARIGDANLLTVPDRQAVINVSEGGVALQVTNADLRKYIPLQRQITFDLIFRLQAPLRFQGKIVHIEDFGDYLRVGVDLEGSAHTDSRTDVKVRLKNLIQTAMSRIG